MMREAQMAIHWETACTPLKAQYLKQGTENVMKFHPDLEKIQLLKELLRRKRNLIFIKKRQILLTVGHGEINRVGTLRFQIKILL